MSNESTISLACGSRRGEAPAATITQPRCYGVIRYCRHIRIIAAKDFNDRLRSGWVLACLLLWLGAVGLTSLFGLLQMGRIGVLGYERTVITLLNLMQYMAPLLGLLLGFDLIVSEKEDQTLRLIAAGGVTRTNLVLGKFLGGVLTLSLPLSLGFIIAGTTIGLAAKDHHLEPFLRLAISALVMGILFLALGLMISTFSRTRVQALVLALLAWCLAVFVFDLVALGLLLSTQASASAQEIEVVCDATHVNAAADLHSTYDKIARQPAQGAQGSVAAPSLGWLALNPIDVFRALNLSRATGAQAPLSAILLTIGGWLAIPLGASVWRLRRTDL